MIDKPSTSYKYYLKFNVHCQCFVRFALKIGPQLSFGSHQNSFEVNI